MHARALEKELEAHGFHFARCNGGHRVYLHANGCALTIVNKRGGRWGTEFSRGEVTDIRRTMHRLLQKEQTV